MSRISLQNIALSSFILILFLSAACAQTPSKPLSPFEQELVNVEMNFIGALQQKDVAYVDRTVATDFGGVALNGDAMERWEFMDDARDGLSKDARIYETQVVRMDDTCAVVTYTEIIPGEKIRYRHVSDAWVKQGDAWKLKFEHRTPRMWSALDLD